MNAKSQLDHDRDDLKHPDGSRTLVWARRGRMRLAILGSATVLAGGGAYAVGNASSGSSAAGTANAGPAAHTAGPGPRTTPAPGAASGPVPTAVYGQVPENWHPGSGASITGTAANKAKAVAVAKYPGGTVNRVLHLSDGSYAVHFIGTSGPHHVFVSKDFKVTGAA
jgi:hypothetical protein